MPVVQVREELLNKDALIVGNGGSCAYAHWRSVRSALRNRGSGHESGAPPDLVLINRTAIGRTVPTIAVTVSADILLEYQAARLHEKCKILTNAVDRVLGHGMKYRQDLAALLSHENFLSAPAKDWPPHASGPLATWVCSALGYRTIYLFGFDGSLTPRDETSKQTRDQVLTRARENFWNAVPVWEVWMQRFLWARRPVGGESQKKRPRLVRVWPDNVPWKPKEQDDPLAAVLFKTVEVRGKRIAPVLRDAAKSEDAARDLGAEP